MRAVKYNPKKINYPDGWDDKAKEALKEIAKASKEERPELLTKYRGLWADLKPELKNIMHGKCWYTESMQVGTDTDVDHFRPKGSVKNAKKKYKKDHPGYWWRAFDPKNYRYSCIIANRLRRDVVTGFVGGKADEFPLWDEKQRAWTPKDNCDIEQPLLIDPCKPSEVALITFVDNGEAAERYSKKDKPKLYEKANKSILLYHLNHDDFVRERIKIRDRINKYIEDAQRYYEKLDKGNAQDDHVFERAIEELREMCSESAPFSSFAIAMLRPHRMDDRLEGVFIGTDI